MDSRKITRKTNTPLTLKQVDSIYWLGRYTERVLTTIKFLMDMYDSKLDSDFDYAKYCQDLDIYNGFTSLADFCDRYAFDRTYPSSIIASMFRSYDNAIMLRETIGSDALSYIEIAVRRLEEAQYSKTPVLDFQKVIDNIMAFKGQIFDSICDHNVRSILNCGLTIERLDMYLRLNINKDRIAFECNRLSYSVAGVDLNNSKTSLAKACEELCNSDEFMDNADRMIILQVIDSLFMKAEMAA
ncbi:alpha-E domain-containing protein [Treponema sp.]|uniref:alpha-E domain-containing protein n=1 Tax=Treponema sp. TaxID=166 RepID=UPI00298D711C|nr:alpha-E domain-containing protein [Treponema sp.]MCQ2240344.1 alpha-E domain-containing protein [Treponema sp.]